MRIGPAANVARVNVAETISAAWTFTGDMDLDGLLDISEADLTIDTDPQHDVAPAAGTLQRVSITPVVQAVVTGFSGGAAGRVLMINNLEGGKNLILNNEDVLSVAANRLRMRQGLDITIPPRGGMILVYDSTLSRWVVAAESI